MLATTPLIKIHSQTEPKFALEKEKNCILRSQRRLHVRVSILIFVQTYRFIRNLVQTLCHLRRYTYGGHSNDVFFHFLKSVITTHGKTEV